MKKTDNRVQRERNARAAKRFLRKSLKGQGSTPWLSFASSSPSVQYEPDDTEEIATGYEHLTYEEIREQEIAAYRTELAAKLRNDLRAQLNCATTLLVVAHLESAVKELALWLHDNHELPFRLNELSGGSWTKQVAKYFRQLPEWPFPEEAHWNRLGDVVQVRNRLAHGMAGVGPLQAADFPERVKELQSLAKKFDGTLTVEATAGGDRELAYLNEALGVGFEPDTIVVLPDQRFCRDTMDLADCILKTLYSPWL